jgi:hypothetical protein
MKPIAPFSGINRRVLLSALASLPVSSSALVPAHAGPCTIVIAQFERAVRHFAGDPNAGPMARQSIGAQLDRQPTPGSVKRAEERAQGNRTGCRRALAADKRMYNF